jgi:hypothetical protein
MNIEGMAQRWTRGMRARSLLLALSANKDERHRGGTQ